MSGNNKFCKDDLKTGMVVKLRNGKYCVVMPTSISNETDDIGHACYTDDLLCDYPDDFDIMAAYIINTPRTLMDHLKGEGLSILWERVEQTPAQRKIEILQAKMAEMQGQVDKLQGVINE
jgi:hypothetical protein